MRPMGLKVNYTFEKDQQNCLARWPHVLQIQTAPIDERTTIGVVDLRMCLQAIAQCSPEIVNQPDKDYAVYALDYSEEDVPLVGQGMLSWGLDQTVASPEQKLVTGRVTKNMLAIFGNGVKETLEVKLKLNSVPRMQRPQTSHNHEIQRGYGSNAPTPTPTDTAGEWTNFIQSNPGFGRPVSGPSAPSPNLAPARFGTPVQVGSPAPEPRPDYFAPAPPPAAPTPPPSNTAGSQPTAPMSSFGPAPEITSTTSKASGSGAPAPTKKPKRSSSKAPSKKKTGNPRGRPPKHPRQDAGDTSAIEDATDGDEPSKKKRAKTTKADWPKGAPLDSAPGSLRVAASTSGSLRTMRPAASGGGGAGGNHLQEVPRAPTPVPGQAPPRPLSKSMSQGPSRRPSVLGYDGATRYQVFDGGIPGPPGQDARSPSESIAQSPHQAYTPEESPADIGSSPPVPRSAHSMRSSPPLSSPVLPPMPMPQPDSGFMSGGFDSIADYDDMPLANSLPPRSEDPGVLEATRPAPPNRPKAASKPAAMIIEQVCPGPPELLPKKSIYRPKSSSQGLSKKARGTGTKAVAYPLKRANTEPNLQRQETPVEPTGPPSVPQLPSELETIEKDRPQTGAVVEPAQEPVRESVIEPASDPKGSEPAALPSIEDAEDGILRLLDQPLADGLPMPDEAEDAHELPAMSEPPRMPSPRQSTTEAAVPAPQPSVAASDPGLPEPTNLPYFSYEEEEDQNPPSKNFSRKQSIKAKLEKAIEAGQMPTFCSNCGAISTPTWRKVFSQRCEGSPEFPVFSDKPGCITAIVITKRDENEKPLEYQVIKKALGPTEDKAKWNEDMLCNSCGIWLSKFKSHRPKDRWESDPAQLGKPRKKGNGKSRSKKAKAQNKGSANLTSEAYFTTDPIGPGDEGSSPENGDEVMLLPTTEPPSRERGSKSQSTGPGDSFGNPDSRGSSKSHDNGKAQGPAAPEDEDLGRTRRLLFPSPKKDGQPKVLGEVAINVVKTSPSYERSRKEVMGQENRHLDIEGDLKLLGTPKSAGRGAHFDDDMADLFGTPPRPSTPPPKEKNNGHFKTPTRPTPSHRPITRSVSKSIRSVRSVAKSPGHGLLALQQTPTKTPRVSSATRHTAQRYDFTSTQHLHAHFFLDSDMAMFSEAHGLSATTGDFDSPFSSTLNQLLSEAHDFTTGSSAHGLGDLDIASLPTLDSDAVLSGHLEGLDFGHFLTTDAVMPSSPPLISKNGGGAHSSFGEASQTGLDGEGVSWESFGEVMMADAGDGE